MKADEAIAKMIPPSKRRPGIWREGVMQCLITRTCTEQCFHCTQNSQLKGPANLMTPDQFETFCQSIEGYFGVVGIFGGAPTLSRYFEEICEIMRKYIPFEQRGIWTNTLNGKGAICRQTFNPKVSNLNMHTRKENYEEFVRDWPESIRQLKGMEDSRHAPTLVALQDVIADEEERWDLISECYVNKLWSSYVSVFRGELRAWFCEIAGAQSILHQSNPNYPDTGLPVTPGWWKKPIQDFKDQINYHCHACGIPLNAFGELALGGTTEYVSQTHFDAVKPKDGNRNVQLVTLLEQLPKERAIPTNYIQNAKRTGG